MKVKVIVVLIAIYLSKRRRRKRLLVRIIESTIKFIIYITFQVRIMILGTMEQLSFRPMGELRKINIRKKMIK